MVYDFQEFLDEKTRTCALRELAPVERFGLALLLQDNSVTLQDLTDAEQACVSDKISEFVKEGVKKSEAIAKAISICTNGEKSRPEKSKARQDETIDVKPKPNIPGGKFTAKQNADGTWDIFDVPIFAEHEVDVQVKLKNGQIVTKTMKIGKAWMVAALNKSFQRFTQDEFIAPLHVHHHGMGKETVRAGFFKPKAVRQAPLEGKQLWTMFADLIQIPDPKFQLIRAGELPFRSVEIFDVTKPELNSLALLDDEVPFFRFKLLTIGKELSNDGGKTDIGPIQKSAYRDQVFRAYQSVGRGARVLMYMGGFNMARPKTEEPFDPRMLFQDDPEKKKPEEMAGHDDEKNKEKMNAKTALNLAAKAFQTIGEAASVAMKALQAAGDSDDDEDEKEKKDKTPAPVEAKAQAEKAAADKAAADKKAADEKAAAEVTATYDADGKPITAALANDGEVVKLRGEVDGMKLERQLERKVTLVSQDLATYGHDRNSVAKQLYALGKEKGIDAIDVYADGVKSGAESDDDSPYRGQVIASVAATKKAAKYQHLGEAAVEAAQKYADEFQTHKEHGLDFQTSEKEYVENGLRSDGFEIPEEEEE